MNRPSPDERFFNQKGRRLWHSPNTPNAKYTPIPKDATPMSVVV
ncbi:hypothetical protein [Moraxella catarrhalis]|nr:hypothetical protein [Moraxella catarrhalis]